MSEQPVQNAEEVPDPEHPDWAPDLAEGEEDTEYYGEEVDGEDA